MAQVIRDTREALLLVTGERDRLETKCAAYELREEATKVATVLHGKGLELDTELPELVERLEKEAAAGRLPTIAAAAEMIGPNMSFGSTHHDAAASQGGDVFTSFLVGNVG